MNMHQLIYISQSERYFSKTELHTLVEKAKLKNRQLAITGLLLYVDGEFVQLLEGEKHDVKLLMNDILQDSRHHTIKIIKEGTISERQFKQWNMASQLMTRSVLGYFLTQKISPNNCLFNIFDGKGELAENLFIKVRDSFLLPPSYSLC